MSDRTPEGFELEKPLSNEEYIQYLQKRLSNYERQKDTEREGFVRQTLVALTANMAAAYVHGNKIVNWDQIVHQAMEGTQKCWIAIKEDRDRNKSTD
jgi:hypothetical protein